MQGQGWAFLDEKRRSCASFWARCTDLPPDVTADAQHGNLQCFWLALTAVKKQVWAMILSDCKHGCRRVHFDPGQDSCLSAALQLHSVTPRNKLLSAINPTRRLLDTGALGKMHTGTWEGESRNQAPKFLTVRWQSWLLQSHVTFTLMKINKSHSPLTPRKRMSDIMSERHTNG